MNTLNSGIRLSDSQKVLLDLWEGLGEVKNDEAHEILKKYLESKGVKGCLERSALISLTKVSQPVTKPGSQQAQEKTADLSSFMD